MKKIFTIGHSNHSIEAFLDLMVRYEINCIADVRSIPYSKYTPQFNSKELKDVLKEQDILYIYLGKELGARRDERELYTPEGYLDFEKVSQSPLFQSAIERIKTGIDKGFNIALMCAEKDPIDCHRNILVARQFHESKYNVLNIMGDGSVQSQDNIEQRLLDLYFSDRMQPTLFGTNDPIDEANLIANAYRLKNMEIGYGDRGDVSPVSFLSDTLAR